LAPPRHAPRAMPEHLHLPALLHHRHDGSLDPQCHELWCVSTTLQGSHPL